MFVEKLKKDKLFLGGFIALALAAILGIALGAAALGAQYSKLGRAAKFIDYFKSDSGLGSGPSWLSTHAYAGLALGIVTLLVGLAVLGLTVVSAVKPDMLNSKTTLIVGAILLAVVIIFGSIAVSFANDVVDPTWFAKQLKQNGLKL